MAKLFKRGRIWYAWVRRKHGGVRKVSTLCTDKRAAEAALVQLEREAVDPAYAAANKTTTQHVLDEYLRSRERLGRAAETLRFVRQKAGALLGLLPKLAGDISYTGCSKYVDVRLQEGAMRTTVRKELGVLKAALRLAKKRGEWLGDPEAVIPELDDDYEPRKRALTPWELVGLASVLPADRAAHVVFIVALGARWSESIRYRRDDAVMSLNGMPWERPGASWSVRLRGTKTKGSRRVVPLVGVSATLFWWAMARWPIAGQFRPWLNVRRDLAQACAKLGIEPVTPNDLRRTFATWLREAGVEPQLIGAAMGHTDSRMVERVYGRLTPEALGRLLEARTARPDEGSREGGIEARESDVGAGNDGASRDAPDGAPPAAPERGGTGGAGAEEEAPPSLGVTGRYTGCAADALAQSATSSALVDSPFPGEFAANTVRRDRIELSTRGFSALRSASDDDPVKQARNVPAVQVVRWHWDTNGSRSAGARAFRALSWLQLRRAA